MNNLCKLKEKKLQKNLVIKKKCSTFVPGEMAEWSIAAVLKTVELRGSGGSNPSLSAKEKRICGSCVKRRSFFVIKAPTNLFVRVPLLQKNPFQGHILFF